MAEVEVHPAAVVECRPDVGWPDVGWPDVGRPDVGWPDVGWPDVGRPDVGSPERAWRPPADFGPEPTEQEEPDADISYHPAAYPLGIVAPVLAGTRVRPVAVETREVEAAAGLHVAALPPAVPVVEPNYVGCTHADTGLALAPLEEEAVVEAPPKPEVEGDPQHPLPAKVAGERQLEQLEKREVPHGFLPQLPLLSDRPRHCPQTGCPVELTPHPPNPH